MGGVGAGVIRRGLLGRLCHLDGLLREETSGSYSRLAQGVVLCSR